MDSLQLENHMLDNTNDKRNAFSAKLKTLPGAKRTQGIDSIT